jgi:hypothetical protein
MHVHIVSGGVCSAGFVPVFRWNVLASIPTYQTTRCRDREESNAKLHRRQNLKSYACIFSLVTELHQVSVRAVPTYSRGSGF